MKYYFKRVIGRSWLLTRLSLVIFGIGLSVLLLEIGVRISYVYLPFSLQQQTSDARLWGLGGPALGLSINSMDLYKTCVGDERLFARILPDLNEVPIRTGPGNTWHITSKSLGFDNIGFRTPEPSGPWDGVVLGDSFAFCFGVEMEECWTQQLARKTNTHLANLGVHGTGSVSHLRYLEDYGWALNPKIILWQFYINDLRDDYNHIINGFQGCPRPQTEEASHSTTIVKEIKEWLSHTFVTYNLIVSPALQRMFPQLADSRPISSHQRQVITANNKRVMLVANRMYYDDDGPVCSEGMKLTKEAILSAKHQASNHGSRFLLILVPSNLQVYISFLPSDQLAAVARSWDLAIDDIVAFAEEHQIDYIDLRPFLREAADRGESLYPAYDVHWNSEGNRFVSDLLANRVIEALTVLDE